MPTACLDSWAVLELLQGKNTAARRVAEILDRERPIMSWLNAGEVFSVIRRSNGDEVAQRTLRDLRRSVEFDDVTPERVVDAARIKADYPLAFADAFACATAVAHDAVLLTGDPELLVDGAPWRWEDLREAPR